MTSHQQKNTQKIFWPLPCFLPSSYTKKSNKRNHTQSHVLRFHRLLSRCVNINTQAVTFCACLLVKHLVKNRPKRGFLSILGDKSVQKSLDYCVNCLLLKIFFPLLSHNICFPTHMNSHFHSVFFHPSQHALRQTPWIMGKSPYLTRSFPDEHWLMCIDVYCVCFLCLSVSLCFFWYLCVCVCVWHLGTLFGWMVVCGVSDDVWHA